MIADRFQDSKYHWLRTQLFLALGLAGLIPIIHSVLLYGVNRDAVFSH